MSSTLRKLFESLYIFLTISDQVEQYFTIIMQSNSSHSCIYYYNVQILIFFFDPEVQMITKPMIKNKLNESLSELKKFEVQTISVLEYKKRNDSAIFHWNAKLIFIDSLRYWLSNFCIKNMFWRKACRFIINIVIIKDFSTFMYFHTLQCGKNILAVNIYKLSVQTKY